jgi:purine-binding chemotaxis protein CheW
MDLVEIRKKSKKKSVGEKAIVSPVTKEAGQSSVQSSASELSAAGRDAAEAAASKPTGSSTLPAAPAVPKPQQSSSGLDVLDALFAAVPDMTLATEEIYLQGLGVGTTQVAGDQQQWLTFSLGKEHYALNIEFVREIIKPRELTDIPRVPAFILGVVSLRGVIVPIFDLCQRLALGSVVLDSRSRIIVCEYKDRIAGLLVDNITQVVMFSTADIEPPPAILSGLDRELVEGVGRIQKKMVILLDLPSVLDIELN